MKQNLRRHITSALCIALASLTFTSSTFALNLSYTPSASYKGSNFYYAVTRVQLSGNPRSDIVAIAKSQLGYTEGNSSSQLNGSANGRKNYTEYGKRYNTQDMWCSMFVSWCAEQAGIPASVVPRTASTVTGLDTFIAQGRAYTRSQVANGSYVPKPGDIIYFKGARNDRKTNHVGIVTAYSGGTVFTIEGNTSLDGNSTNGGGVYEKSYAISNSYIVYICSPGYTSNSEPAYPSIPSPSVSTSCYPACSSNYTSIVNALKSIGVDSSYSNRKKIADANGLNNYQGTSSQNLEMLRLLKAGQLKKAGGTSSAAPAVAHYPACSNSHTSISAALQSIGEDGSYAKRKLIAAANHISNYRGTSSQNLEMLRLLKAGQLKKA